MYLTSNAILPKIRSVKESEKQISKAVRVYIKAHQEKRGKGPPSRQINID